MDPDNAAASIQRTGAVRYSRLKTDAGVPTDRYSVQCWFLSTVPFHTNAVHTVFGRGNSSGEARDTVGVGGASELTQSGRVYFYEPASGRITSGRSTLDADTWYHVVFVRNGAEAKVYLNGHVEINTQAGPWPGGDGEQLTVGNRADYLLKRHTLGLTGLIDEVAVWDRPLEPSEVTELYKVAGPIPPPPAFVLFADASTSPVCFLAQAGQAKAVIAIGRDSGPFYRWVAGELQRYLRELTAAELPIITSDAVQPGQPLVVLGGPKANPLIASAQAKRLVDFAGLKQDGFIIQTVDLGGQPAIVAGGNDEASTMYAAYELLERLGVAFQLTGDIIPQQRRDLKLPAARVRMEPALRYRGLHMRHFVMPWMGLDEFRRMIDQMAKLKFNYLEFYWYVGAPHIEYSHRGEKRQIDPLYTKDSGYLTWHHTAGTHAAKDVTIGREHFRQDRVCAPEFQHVQNQEQAHQVAREWLRRAIDYAHQRKIQIWLGKGDCPSVPPNLAKHSPRATGSMFGAPFIPPGDSVGVEIWEAAISRMIETYPKADGYWIWLAEIGCPGTNDPETQKVLRQYEVNGKRPYSDSDLALVHYGRELIQRLKRRCPQAKVGLAVLFRSRLFRTLDGLVPEDVPFESMESQPYSRPRMEDFAGLGQRETFVVPRLDEDINELAMRFAAGLYEEDRVLSGSVGNGVAGVALQTGRLRGMEQNARYVADGAWNPRLTAGRFHEAYLRRIFGEAALGELCQAYEILQENERAMGWTGFSNFCNYAGPSPVGMPYLDPFEQATPPNAKSDPAKRREGYAAAIPRLGEALKHLTRARPTVLSGAQHELDYVIFKIQSYVLHLETLCAMLDGCIAYDRVVEAKLKEDKAGMQERLDRCRAAYLAARDLTCKTAKLMAAKVEDPDEKYILFRYNFGFVTPIEKACQAMEKWSVPRATRQ
jgi:hypothetical protein